jgi:hypothetical protein
MRIRVALATGSVPEPVANSGIAGIELLAKVASLAIQFAMAPFQRVPGELLVLEAVDLEAVTGMAEVAASLGILHTKLPTVQIFVAAMTLPRRITVTWAMPLFTVGLGGRMT